MRVDINKLSERSPSLRTWEEWQRLLNPEYGELIAGGVMELVNSKRGVSGTVEPAEGNLIRMRSSYGLRKAS